MKLKSLLNENTISGTLVSVDIQPEYENAFPFKITKFTSFINENYHNINELVFLYNGEDMGMVSETNFKIWLFDNELDEEIIEGAKFYDKGYAFFRYCMDEGVSESAIANFVRFMYDNNINDSRKMNRSLWASYLRQYRHTDKKEVYDLLKHADDCVHIPELMDFMRKFNNITMVGGAINECLKEVEIALMALKKPYKIFDQFTY